MSTTDDHLCINDKIDAEDECAESGVDDMKDRDPNKHKDESTDREDDESDEHDAGVDSEVDLSLHGEDGESDTHSSCHEDSQPDDVCAVEGCHDSQREPLSQGEDSETDEVQWKLAPHVPAASEGDQGSDGPYQCHDQKPRIPRRPNLGVTVQGEDEDEPERDDQLHGEDGVHFPNEPHSDGFRSEC